MKLESTSKVNYQEIGFRCGLEIHQQLDTKRKLFCHCPVGLQDIEPDARIIRHMRPTLSELGEYDPTALMEFKTKKHVVYELYRDSTCTYEMDDTPPFPMNQHAVDIVMEIAMMLGCTLVDEIHVSRKQYLDGSIPTGFQRTAVIGVDGKIEYEGGSAVITQVNIEEDSCREVSDSGHVIHWKTDRLSTPLIEVITEDTLASPEEAAKAAMEIGRIMRATGKVRRGHGSVRQDVNVSIKDTTRVEIKGVPSVRHIAKLTHNEAIRQHSLLKLRHWMQNRVSEKEISREVRTLRNSKTDMRSQAVFKKLTKALPALSVNDDIACIRYPGLHGVFSFFLQGSRHFFHELDDRLRVIACLAHQPTFFVSEMHVNAFAKEGAPATTLWSDIMNAMHASERDALAVVYGPAEDVQTAIAEIHTRLHEALQGVPSETRQALVDGTTGFERLLPGPERMYPDTDSPPTVVSPERVARIRENVPETPRALEKKFIGEGLSYDIAHQLAVSPYRDMYEKFKKSASELKWNIAYFLVTHVPRVAKKYNFIFSHSDLEKLVSAVFSGSYYPDALPIVCERLASASTRDWNIEKLWPPKQIDTDSIIQAALDRKSEVRKQQDPGAVLSYLMKVIMSQWRGYVSAPEIANRLKLELQKSRLARVFANKLIHLWYATLQN